MDRERFAALARLISSKPSRRAALAAIFGLATLAPHSHVSAEPGKAKGKGHSKGVGNGHEKGKGEGHQNDEQCNLLQCESYPVPAASKPEFCCKGGFCSCGGQCCANACFQTGAVDNPETVFCCSGPKQVICGAKGEETCCEGSCEECDLGPSAIAGSYRRR